MAVTEALRILIDADTRGAVRGIQQVGATTQRELGRSKKSIDAWGRGLSTVGAGMVALGGAALFGLGKAAMASEEANLATLKLQNTLANMPQLAGENSQQFIDLASAIQSKTAADGDQIVAAEAMLGTFRLTADEVKSITPLVVDYARKFGVDLVSAATQVGKALDGNVGALKRNGVSIDEAAFAADHFTAVQQALAEQVGGFAEAEGKTFAGSVQRMKNELGDLAEGVGVGAVDAFSSMFGVVEGLTDRLDDLSPSAQSAIGKVATFGSVGLVAAGGLSFMIGQTITAVQRFKDAGSAISGFTTKVGGLGRMAAIAGGVAGLGALVVMVDQLEKRAEQNKIDRLARDFLATNDAAEILSDGWEGNYNEMKNVLGAFAKIAEASPQAAEDFLDQAEAAGASSDVIGALRYQLDQVQAAQQRTAEDTEATTGTIEDQTGAVEDAKTRLQEYSDALTAMTDPLFAAMDAVTGNRDAQLSYRDAVAGVQEAQAALDEAIAAHGPTSAEAQEATRGLEDAQRALDDAQWGTVESAAQVDGALAGLKDAVDRGDVSVDAFKSTLKQWVKQGLITQGQADEAAASVGGLASQADKADRKRVSIPVNIRGMLGAISNLDAVTRKVNSVPKSVTIAIGIQVYGQAELNRFAAGRIVNKRQHGGTVKAGYPYVVGEQRPELFVPDRDGRILSAVPPMATGTAWGGGGGGTTIIVNVDARGSLNPNSRQIQDMVIGAFQRAGETGRPITIRGRSL